MFNKEKRALDAKIYKLHKCGNDNQTIARKLGIPVKTVSRTVISEERNHRKTLRRVHNWDVRFMQPIAKNKKVIDLLAI